MKVHDTTYSTVVTLGSAVDAEVACELRGVLSDIDTPVNGRLILDLSATPYISADGICVLLNELTRDKHEPECQLEFRHVSEDVGELLNTAGLGRLISG